MNNYEERQRSTTIYSIVTLKTFINLRKHENSKKEFYWKWNLSKNELGAFFWNRNLPNFIMSVTENGHKIENDQNWKKEDETRHMLHFKI